MRGIQKVGVCELSANKGPKQMKSSKKIQSKETFWQRATLKRSCELGRRGVEGWTSQKTVLSHH